MLKFVIPAVAVLTLISVAAQSRAVDSEGPAPEAAMGWRLSHEPGMAKLAYGLADSDQLAIMMTCERGRAQAVIAGDMQPAGARTLKPTLVSMEIDPLDGELQQTIALRTQDPALQRLARSGQLAVQGDGGHFELTATRSERRLIADFFAYCGNDKA